MRACVHTQSLPLSLALSLTPDRPHIADPPASHSATQNLKPTKKPRKSLKNINIAVVAVAYSWFVSSAVLQHCSYYDSPKLEHYVDVTAERYGKNKYHIAVILIDILLAL